MNSPKDQSNPTSNPNPHQVPPSKELMQALQQLYREKAELSQMLWNLVRLHKPEEPNPYQVEVPIVASDPLWSLVLERVSSDNKILLVAGTTPDLTELEKKKIVRFLRGTTKKVEEATTAHGLSHPPAYIEKRIADRIVWKNGIWESVTPPEISEKVMNAAHWPK